jgi:type II secretory pathway predicted ATPase ExeA
MYGIISIPSIEDKSMLSDVMEHFGLSKSLRQADFFETEHHRQLLKDLKAAIHEGGIVALTGVVGSGKTLKSPNRWCLTCRA